MLLEETNGYRIGRLEQLSIEITHCLFIDELKVYQQDQQRLQVANEIIVEASINIGACYRVKNCAAVV